MTGLFSEGGGCRVVETSGAVAPALDARKVEGNGAVWRRAEAMTIVSDFRITSVVSPAGALACPAKLGRFSRAASSHAEEWRKPSMVARSLWCPLVDGGVTWVTRSGRPGGDKPLISLSIPGSPGWHAA